MCVRVYVCVQYCVCMDVCVWICLCLSLKYDKLPVVVMFVIMCTCIKPFIHIM